MSNLAISELSAFEGNLDLTDLIIISRSGSGETTDYASYSATLETLLYALSDGIFDALNKKITKPLGDLSNVNRSQLNLTSFVTKHNFSVNASPNCVLTAINCNDNLSIQSFGETNLCALSTNILGPGLSQQLTNRSLNNGVKLSSLVGHTGIKLAKLTNISDDSDSDAYVYTGDLTNIIKVTPNTSKGDVIASIKQYDNSEISIKNNVELIPKNYKNYGSQCGDEIATYNGKVIKNNLCVTSKTTTGVEIANINGTTIYNGINVNSTAKSGLTIATLTSNNITHSVYLNVTNETDKYKGDKIANINGKAIYNGIVVDNSSSPTTINGVPIRAGIKLGTITPKTTTGNIIATAVTEDNDNVILYSGIDAKALSTNIVNALTEKIDNVYSTLTEKIDNVYSTLLTKFDNYVKKSEANNTLAASSGYYIKSITQTNGKITSIVQDTLPRAQTQIIERKPITKTYSGDSSDLKNSNSQKVIYTALADNTTVNISMTYEYNGCTYPNRYINWKKSGSSTVIQLLYLNSKGTKTTSALINKGDTLLLVGGHGTIHLTKYSITATYYV